MCWLLFETRLGDWLCAILERLGLLLVKRGDHVLLSE